MGTGANTTPSYRLSQVVFMRQTTLPKAF